jgi:hypothetical protein
MFKYQPGNPPDRELRSWLADELRRISNAIGAAEFVQLTPIDVEPAKPSKGMVVWAVGVNWNPGAGEGLYVYNQAGTWDKVN